MKNKNSIGKKKKRSEYDSAWKDVIEEHFEAFLEFFFPAVHRDIDFFKGYVFLDKELRKIQPDGNTGNRYADELVKVYLKNGTVGCICIFIHIEVQGEKVEDFETRFYVYNYRIFDKYRAEGAKVISLAILTDTDKDYRPDTYEVNQWGFELRMKIPLVKIIDYRDKEEKKKELEQSQNPMAMIVRALLKSLKVKRKDDTARFDVKRELIRECYRSGHNKDQIRILIKFIDWILRLPEVLEKKITEEIIRIEEENKMPYVTSWERIAKKEGKLEGKLEGKKEGKKEGQKEGQKEGKLETARRMLLDNVPMKTVIKYTGLTEDDLRPLFN
ncbi:MAG: hypothetical protein GY765_36960 [bacterium]|nr:hypothetical protein [bacterium]